MWGRIHSPSADKSAPTNRLCDNILVTDRLFMGFPFKLGQFGCRSLSGVEANPAGFDSAQPTTPLSQRLLSPALSE